MTHTNRKTRLAFMGIRGIPAHYSGFETFAEEAAPRLAEMGYEVTVYGRSNNVDPKLHRTMYKGVRLIVLPTISHKYFDTVAHTFVSSLHALFVDRYDAILMMNGANAPFIWIPKLAGTRLALNVDGLDRIRKKWNRLGQLYYRLGEFLSTRLPDVIVTDAQVMQDYYRRVYGADSTLIAYGAYARRTETTETLARLGLEPREYVLYVARFEPENNPHTVMEGFRRTRTDKRLVLVGDVSYDLAYKRRLTELAAADPRVMLPGFVYGDGYRELQSHAYAYVQATEVGGTHPALLEAMGAGNCVIANDTPEHVEVLGDRGRIYRKNDVEDLGRQLQGALDDPEGTRRLGERAAERIRVDYSWERIVQQYHELIERMLGRG